MEVFHMKLRMLLMLVAATTLVGVLGAVKYKQVTAAIAQQSAFQMPPEAVTTTVAHQDRWPATFGAIGSVAAVRGVTVSADLHGVVHEIAFDAGAAVKAGDVLVRLDTRTEVAQLAAAEANRDLARANLDRMRGLRDEQIVSPSDFDKAEAEFKQAEATVEEMRATIDRKTIRAPFAGVLGLRQVNLGQYLADGAPIVSLQTLDPVYVNFAVPQQQVPRIRAGTAVRVAIENTGTEARGTVSAIDSVIDEATRNVQVQATLPNPRGVFRPGMFVQTTVLLGAADPVVTLPASSVAYAPYGDSVFVVTDLKTPAGKAYRGVVQRFVKLGASRGDLVAVVSGVEPGEEVVTSGVFKLRNGAAVQINNRVQPSSKPAPRPDEG
jgi:membrane fusion protein, multidrug efflux system